MSGAYCSARTGPRGGRGGFRPADDRLYKRNGRGVNWALPKFNDTQCAQCTASALAALEPLVTAYPEQSYFAHRYGDAKSWADVEENLDGLCVKVKNQTNEDYDGAEPEVDVTPTQAA